MRPGRHPVRLSTTWKSVSIPGQNVVQLTWLIGSHSDVSTFLSFIFFFLLFFDFPETTCQPGAKDRCILFLGSHMELTRAHLQAYPFRLG